MKNSALVKILFTLSSITFNADAILIDRGNGLIYDDVLDVTWVQNANLAGTTMDWDTAEMWVKDLSFAGFDDWRLPTLMFSSGPNNDKNDFNFNCGTGRFNMDASGCDFGWSSSSVTHELAYMFYVNLGNFSSVNTDGSTRSTGALNSTFQDSQGHTGNFTNLNSSLYWYGNEFDSSEAYFFATSTGGQFKLNKSASFFAWAVRDGDVIQKTSVQLSSVPVPEPGFGLLFLTGLVAMRKNLRL